MTVRKYIVIDDDPMTLFLCRVLISKAVVDAQIASFEKPEEALAYIEANYPLPNNDDKTIVLLDINMPNLSGWDFIEELRKLSPAVINQLNIYIQSSSVDSRDIERAESDPNIVDYISKPLKKDFLAAIVNRTIG